MKIEDKITKTLDKIRPFLAQDGGGVEFIKFEDGIVYVKLLGACSNCQFKDTTIRDSIEDLLIEEVLGVIGVQEI
ncbi:hypothetical protein ASO20_00890 [Mycoplasma sp. (ex Biomphalaria glabrata)]|uniref:NifU family protein n=1 Tax=Mycoplasma sp. (ex Biomphalaria glabrata) TaxID=1749074 RepID=UPI00073AD159|nr:NifU family protein [Mycoplasma sp. (ex Biomphalaria glabrata)]ALV23225.1 hypothetical protein ASO20_00890 [Mycoplasma sp. (ex Biomphalaria glabrata)]